ncbi:MAG: asparagine synthase [Candidatus Eisenbacteria bacterium]|uniref:asparagine synthase (glutamine-hydrolyzing) n=1 Tax=Eiseniibacteriota bacterium TaxID=2212470 RepID=A0A937X9X7_UNCEI|nr:asparagine synthase [Candidatus Eisenbacteria bacterium]
METLYDRPIAGRRVRVLASPAGSGAAAARAETGRWTLRLGRCAAPPAEAEEDAEPTLVIDEAREQARFFVPFSATGQLFQARRGEALCFATDPRLLARPGATLDPRAILCLLEFGALTPPLSLWREVRRLAPGRWTIVSLADLAQETRLVDPWSPAPEPDLARLDADSWEALVAARLDAALRESCPAGRPAILFSGGVDSGLLAARAAAFGWGDTLLANYSRGPDDPEAALAAAMAARLGLRCVALADDPADWAEPIRGLAAHYPQPLGDYSMIPTLLLHRRVEELAGSGAVVWDGSGADGVFGDFLKLARWRRLYRWPAAARRLAGWAYRAGSFWGADRALARRLAAARISGETPFLLASMIAEHPLRGIAYDADPRDLRALHEAFAGAVAEIATLPEPEAPSRILDLRHIVCDFTAQKDAPLGLGRPVDIAYPFLAPSVVRLGVRAAGLRREPGESKAVLKRLLARAVPPEMVYRPKSGFMPPIHEAFRAGPVREALAEAIAPGSPLAPWLRRRPMEVLLRAAGRRRLAHRTYNFLWMVLCAAHWIRRFDDAGGEAEPAGGPRRAGAPPAGPAGAAPGRRDG